jgi:virulence-associated protein VagC
MVRLPAGFQFTASEVAIRRDGEAVILEPLKSEGWPDNFFEMIRIDDPPFQRAEQGTTPIAPDVASL